eukprot:137395-Chlamydomonas_euryale.AAC.1
MRPGEGLVVERVGQRTQSEAHAPAACLVQPALCAAMTWTTQVPGYGCTDALSYTKAAAIHSPTPRQLPFTLLHQGKCHAYTRP